MITDSTYERSPRRETQTFTSDMPEGPYQVFGIELEEAARLNDQFDDDSIFTPSYNKWENQLCVPEYQKYVPRFILNCIRFVNDYGLKEEGLYRVSGSAQEVRNLRDSFITQGPNYEIPPTTDVHAITSLIKNFLRELPSLALPVTSCHTFLAYTQNDVPTELSFANGTANFSLFTEAEQDLNPCVIPTQILQEILQSQSPYNFALIQTLTRHFDAIVEQQSYNRMSLPSLALILCPTLKIHKSVFHALVLKSDRLWTDLHPRQSELSSRSLKYDPRNIMTYQQDDEVINYGTGTASSNVSLTDDPTLSSIEPVLDPITYDLFSGADRRASLMLPNGLEEDDYFDANFISFASPLAYPVKPSSESISSLSTSSTNTRYSEISDFSDFKAPSLSQQEYRFKHQPSEKMATRYSATRSVSNSVPNNRKVFLRKSVANF